MRVGILSIIHESNTFFSRPTTFEDFQTQALLKGDAIREHYQAGHNEITGFFQGLKSEGIEAVPLLAAYAEASGTIDFECAQKLWSMAQEELEQAGALDGLLLAFHGAAVSDVEGDLDGWWLSQLRARVGKLPMVCTLDPHANVSQRMVRACDAMISYRSNPHIDQRERGLEAASLMAGILRQEVKPTHALAMPPVVINIEKQLTQAEPCLSLYALAETLRHKPGVLSVSINLGFPYADVSELGSSFIVVTDNDPELAQDTANQLADYLLNQRHRFLATMHSLEDALATVASAPKPVCLLDMGDNVGGGSPGDGTFLAQALYQRLELKSLVCLFDPDAVKTLRGLSIGTKTTISMGAKTDLLHGQALHAEVTLLSSHEGIFYESEARHGGQYRYDMGPTVLLRAASLTLMLMSKRIAPFSLQQLLSCGLNPSDFDVIVAKGVHAPVAAYAPVCPTLIRVNTPGVTCADLGNFNFYKRRKPLFPFEDLQDLKETLWQNI